MPTTTNYGWTTPADTDLVKDGASAIRTLGTAIDTTVFNNASAAIAKSIVDAKGDIIAATAADTVARLAVGSNDQYLVADSSTATGLKWATLTTGGMTLISEQVANANTSMDFTSISGTYKQLFLVWSGIYHNATGSSFGVRFNSDSASNYVNQGMRIYGAGTAQNDYFEGTECFYALFGDSIGSTTVQNTASGTLLLDNYASTTKKKFLRQSTRFNRNGTLESAEFSGFYKSLSAVTSLNIVRTGGTGNFSNLTDTSIRLYGIA